MQRRDDFSIRAVDEHREPAVAHRRHNWSMNTEPAALADPEVRLSRTDAWALLVTVITVAVVATLALLWWTRSRTKPWFPIAAIVAALIGGGWARWLARSWHTIRLTTVPAALELSNAIGGRTIVPLTGLQTIQSYQRTAVRMVGYRFERTPRLDVVLTWPERSIAYSAIWLERTRRVQRFTDQVVETSGATRLAPSTGEVVTARISTGIVVDEWFNRGTDASPRVNLALVASAIVAIQLAVLIGLGLAAPHGASVRPAGVAAALNRHSTPELAGLAPAVVVRRTNEVGCNNNLHWLIDGRIQRTVLTAEAEITADQHEALVDKLGALSFVASTIGTRRSHSWSVDHVAMRVDLGADDRLRAEATTSCLAAGEAERIAAPLSEYVGSLASWLAQRVP